MELPKGVFVQELAGAETRNQQILRDFLAHEHDEDITRTHYFDGRFENIYLGTEQVPAMLEVIRQACQAAKRFTASSTALQAGFWFNAMYPGHTTTLHTHDDDDERLSGVYYVTVPERSGDLILHTDEGLFTLTPKPGRLVFFPPDMPHEVSKNCADAFRLSVGMNFGPQKN